MISSKEIQHMEVSDIGSAGRVVLCSCRDYAEAQRIVDYLSDREFPVEHTAIVAHGLALVEQVTGGHRRWSLTLLGDIAGGALMGFLIGTFLGTIVIEPMVAWRALLLWSTAIGAICGFVFSLVELSLKGSHHDFSSVGAITAERFDVVVDSDVEAKAKEMLSGCDPS